MDPPPLNLVVEHFKLIMSSIYMNKTSRMLLNPSFCQFSLVVRFCGFVVVCCPLPMLSILTATQVTWSLPRPLIGQITRGQHWVHPHISLCVDALNFDPWYTLNWPPIKFGIGATIRTSWEIQCLLNTNIIICYTDLLYNLNWNILKKRRRKKGFVF